MAIVYRIGKPPRQVKNLGWLLRNWKDVGGFRLTKQTHGFPYNEGFMVAFLKGGGTYETEWASFSLMQTWLDRPVFRGVPVEMVVS